MRTGCCEKKAGLCWNFSRVVRRKGLVLNDVPDITLVLSENMLCAGLAFRLGITAGLFLRGGLDVSCSKVGRIPMKTMAIRRGRIAGEQGDV